VLPKLTRDLHAFASECEDAANSSGNVWDNAVMESFFSTLKTERTNPKHYSTRNAARADVFNYIERFYNPIRRHSTLGNISAIVFERAAIA
jgi:putative transposase